jgi:DNA (cytosine-5)-methyltransferase 1
VQQYRVVEICAGAGGQSLGLEVARFEHELAVELDPNAASTLRHNRPRWKVAEGDVASAAVWDPAQYEGIDLLAGGVPCPPFTIAGKQLGASDERDLFAWAIELCGTVRPRALLLENVLLRTHSSMTLMIFRRRGVRPGSSGSSCPASMPSCDRPHV